MTADATATISGEGRTYDEMLENYDIHAHDIQANHFDLLEYMRSRGPIHWSSALGGHWNIVGYNEVVEAVRDVDTFSSASGTIIGLTKPRMWKPLESDPPENIPWRRLMMPFFTQARANTLIEPMLEQADELIDGFIEDGHVNIVHEYALPLEDYGFFKVFLNFTTEQMEYCVSALDQAVSAYSQEERSAGWAKVGEFVNALWDERLGQPSDGGLIDVVRTATIDGEPISKEDFEGWGIVTIAGGSETTPKALGTLFIVLADRPDVRHRAAQDPAYLARTIDELIRQQSPSNVAYRTVTKDVTFAGQKLRKGDKAALFWSSANRDERLCPHASEFDPDREPTHHVGFGSGAHRCIGERHARVLMFSAAQRFFQRIPDYQLDPDQSITWLHGMTRGPVEVPILFEPGNKIRR